MNVNLFTKITLISPLPRNENVKRTSILKTYLIGNLHQVIITTMSRDINFAYSFYVGK